MICLFTGIRFARWTFIVAAMYGLIAVGPWLVHEPAIVRNARHQQPEIYFGFAWVVIAWQVVFVLIATDPVRYRQVMLIAAVLEKFSFVVTLVVLMAMGIAGLHWIPPAVVDGVLGTLFLIAWRLTRVRPTSPQTGSTR